LSKITLVLGGARSGKSRHAEALVTESGLKPVYLATAQAFDDEMRARIAEHRARRGGEWDCVEEPLELERALISAAGEGRCVLVDCLTLWTTNLMLAERDAVAECQALAARLPGLPGRVVFVSNEVGLGIVPDNAMARRFRDLAGTVNQAIAAAADEVFFVAAGLPLRLKPQVRD
jgi:adenosylcobinamide kinase/adenosylcobinamide-phosphate guanylyltransferase